MPRKKRARRGYKNIVDAVTVEENKIRNTILRLDLFKYAAEDALKEVQKDKGGDNLGIRLGKLILLT